MASERTNIDSLISDLGGCMSFQVLLVALSSLTRIMASMSMIMMAFGNYDPGWKCLDNVTTTDVNEGNLSISSPTNASRYTDQCQLYKDCTNIQFKPGISTIVTEWQLICDKSWIVSLIISLQMGGVLLGSFLAGYLGDRIGRTRTLIVATCYHTLISFITIFPYSWYMFAAMRFLIGVAVPILIYTQATLSLEFVARKWRTFVMCIPTLAIAAITVSLIAMTTGKWMYIQVCISIGSFISLIPFLWIPESLRWLLVNNKRKDAIEVVKKIASLNRKSIDETVIVESLAPHFTHRHKSHSCSYFQLMCQLLRRGVRYPTCVVGFVCLIMSMIYYALNFGVKSLPGNFFTNLILMACVDIPFLPIAMALPNYLGRKLAIIIFSMVNTICLFIVVGLDLKATGGLQTTGILVCVIVARGVVEGTWDTTVTYMGEIFPTTLRSTSLAYTSWIARIGGILAPYLIPDNPDVYFINYLIMASCALICCFLVIFLPETNGQPLRDTWEESTEKSKDESQNAFNESSKV